MTTCSAAPKPGIILIYVTGNNVTIKNGFITGSLGVGLFAQSSDTGTGIGLNQNLVIKDVTFSDNAAGAIASVSDGVMLLNVNASKNGDVGITLSANNILDHVNSSFNKGSGIRLANGAMTNVVTAGNQGFGVDLYGGLVGGTLSNVSASRNSVGVNSQGAAITNSSFGGNIGVGLQTIGGMVSNVTAAGNNGSTSGHLTTAQYTFDPITCYVNAATEYGTIGPSGINGSVLTGCQ